ncbi:hypothetical protein AArcMg_0806 [Natrarchaeobaculum sulfurireducens]|uniref:Uncharacterized protein n=1 Tax=Natrarchaeobaculum sulfurireducens TaxID=2044521 RepID=A0A346PMT2_9EURY|nr:hypothetical protein AArcMg_0806 [Natrarchaeobaculum sulfurireducens]
MVCRSGVICWVAYLSENDAASPDRGRWSTGYGAVTPLQYESKRTRRCRSHRGEPTVERGTSLVVT